MHPHTVPIQSPKPVGVHTVGYVYDIAPVITQLHRTVALEVVNTPHPGDRAQLTEALIDAFIKHSIAEFQIVGLQNPPMSELVMAHHAWFLQQQTAKSMLWNTLIFPPDVSGSDAYVLRIIKALWVFVPMIEARSRG